VQLEELGKLKKSSDLSGNRIRDLPACIVPQPTMLPRTPDKVYKVLISFSNFKNFIGGNQRLEHNLVHI
jgi:hypothetical protein